MYEQTVKTFIDVAKKYIGDRHLTVVEFGALDCKETLGFNSLLNEPTIFTFECNPNTLPLCRKRVKKFKNIHLIEKAVSNIDGKVKFYPIDQKKTLTTWKNGNPGASSLFKVSGKYPVEKYVQREVEVDAITLKSFMKLHRLKHIDLLWMDIQGAELLALQGLSGMIKNVKFIYTEAEFFEIYKDQPLFEDIKYFLTKNGFMFLGFSYLAKYAGDAIFINRNIVSSPLETLKIFLMGDSLLIRKRFLAISLLFSLKRVMNYFVDGFGKVKGNFLREIHKYIKTFRRKLTLLKFNLSKNLVLEIKYGGLGDHLFYSHIPRIAKETNKYKKVYISNRSLFNNKEIKKLVWDINPYIDGFCDGHGLSADVERVLPTGNLLDEMMLYCGIDDGKRFHEPEVYYKPTLREEFKDKVVYDPNYLSNAGDKNMDNEVIGFFKENNIHVDYQMKLRKKNIPIDNFDNWLESKSLEDFCDIIYSCKKIYCLVTGTATLAPALGKTANVLFNNGVACCFLHSKINNFINLSRG